MMPAMQEKIGKYVLQKKLGEGSMAQVYLASEPGFFNRRLVLKRIKKAFSLDNKLKALFRSEASTLCHLFHPNFVFILDYGEAENQDYIVMEYVAGQSLYDIFMKLQKLGKVLSQPAGIYITKEIADGISYLHQAVDPSGKSLQLLHTDLAPRNILIHHGGWIKIIDFSMAQSEFNLSNIPIEDKWAALGDMAPEQLQGVPWSQASEIFQIGLILFKIIFGRSPYRATDYESLHQEIVEFDISHCSLMSKINPSLQKIIYRVLANDPSFRYSSACELSAELAKTLNIHFPDYDTHSLSMELKNLGLSHDDSSIL